VRLGSAREESLLSRATRPAAEQDGRTSHESIHEEDMRGNRQQSKVRRGGRALGFGLALSVGVISGCDGLLDVDLPGQIVEDAVFQPSQAVTLVSSAIGTMECAFSEFVGSTASGNEDVFLRVTGWWGGSFEYQTAPGTANCNTGETGFGWWTSLHYSRYLAEATYARLGQWSDAEVANRGRLQAQTAIYAGLAYEILGSHFCEIAVEAGPAMSPDETLAAAEKWYTDALGHIGGTDFAIPGGVTTSARQMALTLRARTRFARGNMEGAAADARLITNGYRAFATRTAGGERTRWNRVVNANNNAGWGTVSGPITWWTGPGNWPETIPYTGYRNLGIRADGRAVLDTGHAVLTTEGAGIVRDTRTPVNQIFQANGQPLLFNAFPVWRQVKYTSLESNIPLANWEEARLILAEVEGGQAAIDHVNVIRTAHNLPRVTYLSPTDAAGIQRMIIEERRRSLFLEGRFWSYKILRANPNHNAEATNLWFPRGYGQTPYPYNYQLAVRMAMPENEYVLNPNLSLNDRGTKCAANQRPAL
jgi:hypothetical protein